MWSMSVRTSLGTPCRSRIGCGRVRRLNQCVEDTLTRNSIERRGLFRFEEVERLRAEHNERRHNHSHRLWALFVLEHWLRARFD